MAAMWCVRHRCVDGDCGVIGEHEVVPMPSHVGRYVDGGDYGDVWECDTDCPHPEHESEAE